MSTLYNILLYQPLLNVLVFFYSVIPGKDIGIAIIILTLLIRLVLYPLNRKALEAQKVLQDVQPKLEEVKKKYSNDKETMAKELMKLYSEHNINPFSSCLPLLIQIPIFIALYHVFQTGLSNGSLQLLYSFIPNPGSINTLFLRFIDLSKPQPVLAIIAGIAQYFQTKMLFVKKQPVVPGASDENALAMMNKQMMVMMPILTVVIGFTLPGGLTLYWLITTVLMWLQQKQLFK